MVRGPTRAEARGRIDKQLGRWQRTCKGQRLLEPQTTIYKWLFQLDDSQSLHRKWLFHQTSIYKWLEMGFQAVNLLIFGLELPRNCE